VEGIYPVYLDNEPVGKVSVTRKGLYYHFLCRLQLPDQGVYRVCICCGDQAENLGIPLPEGRGFALEKSLPVSRLGRGKPNFFVAPKQQSRFVPIDPKEPFGALRYIKNARFQIRNGQPGLIIRDKA
jgi:hypothetical protein